MIDQIKGLHHVTSMAGDARTNNQFFTNALGLRRVKKTVNFDAHPTCITSTMETRPVRRARS